MENTNEDNVREVNNLSKCYRKGIAMYMRSFKKIISKSWPFAIAHAIVFSMLLVTFMDYYIPLNNYANVGMPTNEIMLFSIVVLMIALFVVGGILELLVYLRQLRIFVPQDKPLHTFFRGIKLCFRHFPSALGAVCLSLAVVLPLLLVFLMPAGILALAELSAQVSFLNGDAVNMAGTMSWLTFIVYPITGCVKLLITSLPLFVLYYACGSMIAKDDAKKNFMRGE